MFLIFEGMRKQILRAEKLQKNRKKSKFDYLIGGW